jgi:hypothetical protein
MPRLRQFISVSTQLDYRRRQRRVGGSIRRNKMWFLRQRVSRARIAHSDTTRESAFFMVVLPAANAQLKGGPGSRAGGIVRQEKVAQRPRLA